MEDVRLILGDSFAVLPTLETASVDSLCTDPPAGINFMAKDFDSDRGGRILWIEWLCSIMRECFRVIKPGCYGLVWAIPRTSHWTATALEDAGFEIREKVYHLFATGFPKAKSCLKPAAEEWILVRKPGGGKMKPLGIDECRIAYQSDADFESAKGGDTASNNGGEFLSTKGAMRQSEKITLAGRWPANLVLSHVAPDENGAGGCVCVGTRRVKNKATPYARSVPASSHVYNKGCGDKPQGEEPITYADADGLETVEEWVCVDSCPIRLLDEQAGPSSVTGKRSERSRNAVVEGTAWGANNHRSTEYTDSGNVSRFFYVAKASRRDRETGLDGVEIISIEAFLPSNGEKILWEAEAQKVMLRVDTDVSPPRATVESGASKSIASEWSMFLFGNGATVPSLMGSTFTIETKTNSTTGSRTLNWLMHLLTNGCTADANFVRESGGSRAGSVARCNPSLNITIASPVSLPGVGPVASGTRLRITGNVASPASHPTVKSIALMSWLVKLVCPPGGLCLDPFAGSGSTLLACLQTGRRGLGIEVNEEYYRIAEKRIAEARAAHPLFV